MKRKLFPIIILIILTLTILTGCNSIQGNKIKIMYYPASPIFAVKTQFHDGNVYINGDKKSSLDPSYSEGEGFLYFFGVEGIPHNELFDITFELKDEDGKVVEEFTASKVLCTTDYPDRADMEGIQYLAAYGMDLDLYSGIEGIPDTDIYFSCFDCAGEIKGELLDIASFSFIFETKSSFLLIDSDRITGNIRDLITSLSNVKNLTILTSPNIVGDISALTELTKLESLSLGGCGLTGDIGVLSELEHLEHVYINGCEGLSGTLELENGEVTIVE